jgi:hypothetical protein
MLSIMIASLEIMAEADSGVLRWAIQWKDGLKDSIIDDLKRRSVRMKKLLIEASQCASRPDLTVHLVATVSSLLRALIEFGNLEFLFTSRVHNFVRLAWSPDRPLRGAFLLFLCGSFTSLPFRLLLVFRTQSSPNAAVRALMWSRHSIDEECSD